MSITYQGCISLANFIMNRATTAAMDTQVTDAGMALHTLAEVHRSENAKLRVCSQPSSVHVHDVSALSCLTARVSREGCCTTDMDATIDCIIWYDILTTFLKDDQHCQSTTEVKCL